MLPNITGLIFDLDDTLVDSNAVYEAALLEVGIDPKGDDYQAARKNVKGSLGSSHVAARNRLLYFKEYHSLLESSFSARRLLELMDRYETAVEKRFREQWKALGRDRLFSEISHKFDCAIITNENTRMQMIKLRAMDPEGIYFKQIVTSEEVGCEKPEMRIFDRLFKVFSHPPKTCIMIGNDSRVDLEPAAKLGVRTVLTTQFDSASVNREGFYPDYQIQDLNEVGNLLKGLSE